MVMKETSTVVFSLGKKIKNGVVIWRLPILPITLLLLKAILKYFEEERISYKTEMYTMV